MGERGKKRNTTTVISLWIEQEAAQGLALEAVHPVHEAIIVDIPDGTTNAGGASLLDGGGHKAGGVHRLEKHATVRPLLCARNSLSLTRAPADEFACTGDSSDISGCTNTSKTKAQGHKRTHSSKNFRRHTRTNPHAYTKNTHNKPRQTTRARKRTKKTPTRTKNLQHKGREQREKPVSIPCHMEAFRMGSDDTSMPAKKLSDETYADHTLPTRGEDSLATSGSNGTKKRTGTERDRRERGHAVYCSPADSPVLCLIVRDHCVQLRMTENRVGKRSDWSRKGKRKISARTGGERMTMVRPSSLVRAVSKGMR